MPDDFDDTRLHLEAAKAASVAQLLFRAARLLDAAMLEELREASGLDIRPAHTRLFPHIDLEGTRLTHIAQRAGISKQAAGQLIDDLAAMGAVERIPDPADGRAKLVRFATVDGELSLLHGLRFLAVREATLERAIGTDRWEGLRHGLVGLLEELGA